MYNYKYYKYEYFNDSNKIIFLTKEMTSDIIISDKDNYFLRFNELDLLARNAVTVKDYKDKIIKASCDFTDEQREIITECIENINNKLIPKINESWIIRSKLLDIPWKIGVVSTRIYEVGLPHTRDDTIILPSNQINLSTEFMDTLLHEKLHVYQKTYPDDFSIYLEENKYVKYQKYIDTDIRYRSNPDTDEWIYKKNGLIYVSEYINNPKTILDVRYKPKNSCVYEHPREKSVYDLLNKINKNT